MKLKLKLLPCSPWLRRLFDRFGAKPAHAGSAGEGAAAAWLERERGFRILAANWRADRDRRLEIDLVARDADVLVFVEVKSRPAEALVPGYFAAVSPRKKKAMQRATRAYVAQLRQKPRTVRFDVVEVLHEKNAISEVRHYENVPLFPKEFLRGW
ncbi:MAG: YraN family protein [Opitutaceae bacterium]